MESYLRRGYSKEWINQRLKSIEIRKGLTDEWETMGVLKVQEYPILTDEITKSLTHVLFLDLMNLTDNRPRISEYYDESKADKLGYKIGFGFFPNIMYRVYF